jgi:hypothetical protein
MISFRESQLKRVLENLNKPTEIGFNDTKIWKNKEGKFHRLNDKPAFEYADGKKVWYINGKFIKQNYNSYGMVHNDKFFNEDGNEIIGE